MLNVPFYGWCKSFGRSSPVRCATDAVSGNYGGWPCSRGGAFLTTILALVANAAPVGQVGREVGLRRPRPPATLAATCLVGVPTGRVGRPPPPETATVPVREPMARPRPVGPRPPRFRGRPVDGPLRRRETFFDTHATRTPGPETVSAPDGRPRTGLSVLGVPRRLADLAGRVACPTGRKGYVGTPTHTDNAGVDDAVFNMALM